jgi:glycosyltransferase involved in cell wall biosynthesis
MHEPSTTTASASVRAPEPSQAEVRELLRPSELLAELGYAGGEEDLAKAIPQNVLASGRQFEWAWPSAPSIQPPSIAYLLPGLPPEGSGGSHSLVQEARGMRALGAEARVCIPLEALSTVERLYGNDDELFIAYRSDDAVLLAVGGAAIVVSTEHTSVQLAARIKAERPLTVCAYYVQDYEPLFAPPGSARSDRALLSYRAIPSQVLFAKTHWLRNVVMARHRVPVMKVQPSLDRSLFHAQGRAEREGAIRVAAMVRPRTPRRRAAATLQTLQRIAQSLGEGVEAFAFGCDAHAFAELCSGVQAEQASGASEASGGNVRHLGLLTRAEVAEVMRRTDVFIDASAYQAFGRTGLEAMACGAVPVLPALGGVHEYAAHDRDALIFKNDSPAAIAQAVCALVADRARLGQLREAGLQSAARFSVEQAARSQLGLFAAVTKARAHPVTVTV